MNERHIPQFNTETFTVPDAVNVWNESTTYYLNEVAVS